VLCGLAAGLPVVTYGAVNLAMGQGFWPNSMVIKTALNRRESSLLSRLRTPYVLARRLATEDVLVLAFVVLAVIILVWAWYGGPRRHVLGGCAFIVTVILHTTFADFGWFERYQGYLLALGVYLALGWLSQVVRPAGHRPVLVAVLILILILAPFKIRMLTNIPLATNNTYSQRYQVGLFFDRYYDGRAVATSELGYASLFHDGPFVDLLGLASHDDVLVTLIDDVDDPAFWRRVVDEHDVEVVAAYPGIIEDDVPEEWTLVGEWRVSGARVTGGADFLFWAPQPKYVEPLQRHLEEFAPEMPDNVQLLCVPCLKVLARELERQAGEDP
jgi:hypothetical protein